MAGKDHLRSSSYPPHPFHFVLDPLIVCASTSARTHLPCHGFSIPLPAFAPQGAIRSIPTGFAPLSDYRVEKHVWDSRPTLAVVQQKVEWDLLQIVSWKRDIGNLFLKCKHTIFLFCVLFPLLSRL